MSGFVEKPEPIQVPGLVHLHTGKVRELYRNEAGDLVMVASDRISAYDWVLPTEIPDKGRVLTQLSLWWFDQLADLAPNHVLSTELPPGAPADWEGRALVCKSLRMVPVECVARGYLTGSGLAEYDETRTVCGLALPEGLVDGSELPAPIFTPAVVRTLRDFRVRALEEFGSLAELPRVRNDDGQVDVVGQKRVLRLLYAFMFHYYGHPGTALRLTAVDALGTEGGGGR